MDAERLFQSYLDGLARLRASIAKLKKTLPVEDWLAIVGVLTVAYGIWLTWAITSAI